MDREGGREGERDIEGGIMPMTVSLMHSLTHLYLLQAPLVRDYRENNL